MPAIKIMVGNITVIMSSGWPRKAIIPSVQKIEARIIIRGTTIPYNVNLIVKNTIPFSLNKSSYGTANPRDEHVLEDNTGVIFAIFLVDLAIIVEGKLKAA